MRTLACFAAVLATAMVANADPPPPGQEGVDPTVKPGATALGAGTIFLTKTALVSGDDGLVYLSQGQQSKSLDQPVGSCRLKLRNPGTSLPAGSPLNVLSVDGVSSALAGRGISSVRWLFDPNDPAESLLCDTVGAGGPSQEEVEFEVKGLLQIEPASRPEASLR